MFIHRYSLLVPSLIIAIPLLFIVIPSLFIALTIFIYCWYYLVYCWYHFIYCCSHIMLECPIIVIMLYINIVYIDGLIAYSLSYHIRFWFLFKITLCAEILNKRKLENNSETICTTSIYFLFFQLVIVLLFK